MWPRAHSRRARGTRVCAGPHEVLLGSTLAKKGPSTRWWGGGVPSGSGQKGMPSTAELCSNLRHRSPCRRSVNGTLVVFKEDSTNSTNSEWASEPAHECCSGNGGPAWEPEPGQWVLTGEAGRMLGDLGLFRGSVASFPPDSPVPSLLPSPGQCLPRSLLGSNDSPASLNKGSGP